MFRAAPGVPACTRIMDMNPRSRLIALVLIGAMGFPLAAFATQPGWYVALDAGQARYSGIGENASQWLSLPPANSPPQTSDVAYAPTASRAESHDTAYRATIGYQFDPYFGLEAGFVDLGEIRADSTGSYSYGTICPGGSSGVCLPLATSGPDASSADLRARGWVVAVTGSWPITSQWSLFARLGAFDAHSRLDIANTPSGPTDPFVPNSVRVSDTRWDPTYGIGVDYSPIDHWALRLGWDRYASLGDRNTTGKYSVNLVSLGVVYTL